MSKPDIDTRIAIEQCFIGHNFPNTGIVVRIHRLIAEQVAAEVIKELKWAKGASVWNIEHRIAELKEGQK